MGAKNECGTDGGDEDVMNRGSIAVVNLRSFFVDARTKDVCHCTALPCILQCFCKILAPYLNWHVLLREVLSTIFNLH